ncbi:hypothetical protein PO551_23780, partial [Escherichia coli]
MTTITEIIGRVNTQLVDPMMVRWPLQELCDYYNDAVRAVILARPDAGASLETISCVPGARQVLPDGVIQLLDVICLSDGSAVRPLSREVLDAQYPEWPTMKGIPECFISNDLSPRVFWLFPAPDKEISIDAVVSRILILKSSSYRQYVMCFALIGRPDRRHSHSRKMRMMATGVFTRRCG